MCHIRWPGHDSFRDTLGHVPTPSDTMLGGATPATNLPSKEEMFESFSPESQDQNLALGLSYMCHVRWPGHTRARAHLTQCIYQLLLESQPPHKLVNLIF